MSLPTPPTVSPVCGAIMLRLKSPTPSASTQVTTLPWISVRASVGGLPAYCVHSETNDLVSSADNAGKPVMADRSSPSDRRRARDRRCAHRLVCGRRARRLGCQTPAVNANDLLQDAGAVGELALVAADLVNRGQVGLLERGNELLDAESVVARERLASTHVAQLVEHWHVGSDETAHSSRPPRARAENDRKAPRLPAWRRGGHSRQAGAEPPQLDPPLHRGPIAMGGSVVGVQRVARARR